MNTDSSLSDFNFFVGYESQNVLVFFVLLPLIWAAVIDYKWIRKPIATAAYTVLILALVIWSGGWQQFTYDFFLAGVQFCAYWKRFGYTYSEACIVWCILWPMVFSIALALFPARKMQAAK